VGWFTSANLARVYDTPLEPESRVRTGRHVVDNLHVHLASSPSNGVAFTNAMLKRCEPIMRDVCVDLEAELREFNSETDDVHCPPKVQLSKLVNCIKGVSARLLRKEFEPPRPRLPVGVATSGLAPTSQAAAAERHSPSYANTSKTSNASYETTSPP
jgi:REP element-mobilizing transposase RayT